jgi:hypothetical protein
VSAAEDAFAPHSGYTCFGFASTFFNVIFKMLQKVVFFRCREKMTTPDSL